MKSEESFKKLGELAGVTEDTGLTSEEVLVHVVGNLKKSAVVIRLQGNK